MKKLFASVFVLGVLAMPVLAQTNWTGDGDGTSWSDVSNWDAATTDATIVINSATVDAASDDIANFHPSNGTWWVSKSSGSSLQTSLWADFTTASGWSPQVVGDFNGDGIDDIANFHSSNGTWWVSRSNGTSFSTSLKGSVTPSTGLQAQFAVDVDGDGDDDLTNWIDASQTWVVR